MFSSQHAYLECPFEERVHIKTSFQNYMFFQWAVSNIYYILKTNVLI